MFKFMVILWAVIAVTVVAPSPIGLLGGELSHSASLSLSLGAQHSGAINKNHEYDIGKSYGAEVHKSFAGGFGGGIQHSKESTLEDGFGGVVGSGSGIVVGGGFGGGVGSELQHSHSSEETETEIKHTSSEIQKSVGAGFSGGSSSYGGSLSSGEKLVISGSGHNNGVQEIHHGKSVGVAQSSFNSASSGIDKTFGAGLSGASSSYGGSSTRGGEVVVLGIGHNGGVYDGKSAGVAQQSFSSASNAAEESFGGGSGKVVQQTYTSSFSKVEQSLGGGNSEVTKHAFAGGYGGTQKPFENEAGFGTKVTKHISSDRYTEINKHSTFGGGFQNSGSSTIGEAQKSLGSNAGEASFGGEYSGTHVFGDEAGVQQSIVGRAAQASFGGKYSETKQASGVSTGVLQQASSSGYAKENNYNTFNGGIQNSEAGGYSGTQESFGSGASQTSFSKGYSGAHVIGVGTGVSEQTSNGRYIEINKHSTFGGGVHDSVSSGFGEGQQYLGGRTGQTSIGGSYSGIQEGIGVGAASSGAYAEVNKQSELNGGLQHSGGGEYGGSIAHSHASSGGIGVGIHHSSSGSDVAQHSLSGGFAGGIQHSRHGLGILSGIKEGIHKGVGVVKDIAGGFTGSISGAFSGGIFK